MQWDTCTSFISNEPNSTQKIAIKEINCEIPSSMKMKWKKKGDMHFLNKYAIDSDNHNKTRIQPKKKKKIQRYFKKISLIKFGFNINIKRSWFSVRWDYERSVSSFSLLITKYTEVNTNFLFSTERGKQNKISNGFIKMNLIKTL